MSYVSDIDMNPKKELRSKKSIRIKSEVTAQGKFTGKMMEPKRQECHVMLCNVMPCGCFLTCSSIISINKLMGVCE